ncbi:MAG: outer membrane beta-barrel protein [Steroidobacteraceae bacterium]
MRQISSSTRLGHAFPSAFTPLIRPRLTLLLLASMGSFLAPRIAAAEDPFGFYIGGAVGEATLRSGNVPYLQALLGTSPAAFSAHDTGWKAVIGVRPISFVGAELENIDFGRVHGSIPGTFLIGNVQGDLHSNATALFGVAYLPLPLPLLDVYAKAGVARYQTSDKFSSGPLSCREPLLCIIGPVSYGIDRTDARFAYGVGTQVRLSAFAIRAEYERIAANGADPDLVSLGLTWSF